MSRPASPRIHARLTDPAQTNVLISKTGKAQICDYGLNTIILDPTVGIEAAPGFPGASQWYAPEVITSLKVPRSKTPTASKPADIFAFAMLTVEVFTGMVPWGNMKNKSVEVQILDGKRPEPPAAEQLGLTEEVWRFTKQCWSENPNERPTIDEVVRAWDGFVSEYVASRSTSSASRRTTPRENGKPSLSCDPQNRGLTYRKGTTLSRKRWFCGLF